MTEMRAWPIERVLDVSRLRPSDDGAVDRTAAPLGSHARSDRPGARRLGERRRPGARRSTGSTGTLAFEGDRIRIAGAVAAVGDGTAKGAGFYRFRRRRLRRIPRRRRRPAVLDRARLRERCRRSRAASRRGCRARGRSEKPALYALGISCGGRARRKPPRRAGNADCVLGADRGRRVDRLAGRPGRGLPLGGDTGRRRADDPLQLSVLRLGPLRDAPRISAGREARGTARGGRHGPTSRRERPVGRATGRSRTSRRVSSTTRSPSRGRWRSGSTGSGSFRSGRGGRDRGPGGRGSRDALHLLVSRLVRALRAVSARSLSHRESRRRLSCRRSSPPRPSPDGSSSRERRAGRPRASGASGRIVLEAVDYRPATAPPFEGITGTRSPSPATG